MIGVDRFEARGKESLLEKRYIAKVLAYEANEIWKEQGKAIDYYGLNKTGLMKHSRRWRLVGQGDFYNQHLEIYFVKYLRILDIDPKRRREVTILGERDSKKRRRQYHIYNRIVFGHLNEITKRLAFGFTEEVRASIATELNIEIQP